MDFFGRQRGGDVLARFSTGLATVENTLVNGMPAAFLSVLNILASTTVLFVLNWKLALLLGLAVPFCVIGPRLLGPRALKAGYNLRKEQAELGNIVQENLQAQRVIKAFSLRGSVLKQFQEQSAKILKSGVSFGFLCYTTERAPNIGMGLFNVLVLGVGGYLAYRGELSVGSLVSFQSLFVNVSLSVMSLSSFAPTLLQATSGLRRIHELLEAVPRVAEGSGLPSLAPLQREIRLDHASFSYDGERPNLEDVSLTIAKGTRVAFVGPSGCGKSTCVNLILRFFDPDQGSLSYDGIDLRQARLDSLSAQTGVVFQDNFLFNTSLRENVRMGHPEATHAEVEEACRLAQIHELIQAMPQGYETPAGEGGNRLSVGQRQRLAIARALIRKPSVLILDEATSALDAATESAINHTLEQLGQHQTTISVTHRLGPLVGYDRIFVFESGRLVEAGSHRELLAQHGLYAKLWTKQHAFTLSEDTEETKVDGESLSQITIFRDLDAAMREKIAAGLRVEEASIGTTVIRQGEVGDKFYLVARGRVRVTVQTLEGVERNIAVLQDGDSFGELALLEDAPRNATVVTEAPTTFLVLKRAAFKRLLANHPAVRALILAQAQQRTNIGFTKT
jgi:ATP-binding cassette subfamily B protein